MSNTPQCDKMKAVRPKSQAIGEFIEWLECEKGIFLCERLPNRENLYRTHCRIETLMAEHFGIDLVEVENERRAVLAELRGDNDD